MAGDVTPIFPGLQDLMRWPERDLEGELHVSRVLRRARVMRPGSARLPAYAGYGGQATLQELIPGPVRDLEGELHVSRVLSAAFVIGPGSASLPPTPFDRLRATAGRLPSK